MYVSFLLQWTVSGRWCKHKTDVEAWHGIHLSHKKSLKYSGHTPILNEHWCIYSCLQLPPKENWYQYVRRVYATAIKFPCITTLCTPRFCITSTYVLYNLSRYIAPLFTPSSWTAVVCSPAKLQEIRDSFIRSIHLFIHSFIYSFIYSFDYKAIFYLFILLHVNSFIWLFIHWFL